MAELITDHVWRAYNGAREAGSGRPNGPTIAPGGCAWLGTCGRPKEDHAAVAKKSNGRGAR
jgi:hypothetical protein